MCDKTRVEANFSFFFFSLSVLFCCLFVLFLFCFISVTKLKVIGQPHLTFRENNIENSEQRLQSGKVILLSLYVAL